MTEKYRGDHTGSLLRPEALLAGSPGIRFCTRIKTAVRFKW